MPIRFPFEEDSEQKDALVEGLAAKGSLSQDMYARYKARRQEAINAQQQFEPSGITMEGLAQGERESAIVEGLSKAANRMGTIGGVTAQTDIGDTLGKLDAVNGAILAADQKKLAGAVQAEDTAGKALLDLEESQRVREWEDKTRPLELEQKQMGLESDSIKLSNTKEMADPASLVSQSAQKGLLATLSVKVSDLQAAGRHGEAANLKGTLTKLGSMPLSAVQVSAVAGQYDIDVSKLLQVQATRQARADAERARQEAREDARHNKLADVEQKKKDVAAKSQEETNYRVNTMNSNLDDLEKLVTEYGTVEVFGDASSRMDNLLYQTAVDYAKLVDPSSVAREGEVAAAQKYMLPIKGLSIKNDTAISLIRKMKDDIARRSGFYNQTHGGTAPATGSQPPPPAQSDSGSIEYIPAKFRKSKIKPSAPALNTPGRN